MGLHVTRDRRLPSDWVSADIGISTASDLSPGDWVVRDLPSPMRIHDATRLSQRGVRLCLIDDTGSASQVADLVVVPPTTPSPDLHRPHVVAGPDAVLVRSQFASTRPKPDFGGPVVVAMGGTGGSLAVDVARAVSLLGGEREIQILGPTSSVLNSVEATVTRQRVAETLSGASLMVAMFGHSILEAAVMHVPTVFGWWSHQSPDEAKAFVRRWGTGVLVGEVRPTDARGVAEGFARTVRSVTSDRERWEAIVRRTAPFHPNAAGNIARMLVEGAADG